MTLVPKIQLVAITAFTLSTPSAIADQASESVVFGGIAYFVSQPVEHLAYERLRDDLGHDLVKYLISVNRTIREDPARNEARAQLCRTQASSEAADKYRKVTEASWKQAYDESKDVLSLEQYFRLVDTIHQYQNSFTYDHGIEGATLQTICRRTADEGKDVP